MGLPRVVILGGGFGGLRVARYLKNAPVKLTLVDRTNHHLFQPLLYQVASAALAPRDIAFPIREILKNQPNASVIMDNAVQILAEEKAVKFASGRRLEYDYLIISIGVCYSYFDHPEWEQYAPCLKTIEDAINIRNKILTAFEQAEAADSQHEVERFLTFVIVGGGPTGVELAGEVGSIAQKTMLKNFRNIDPSQAKVYLIEAGKHILPSYPENLSIQAEKDLTKLGVKVLTNSLVSDINQDGLQIGNKTIKTKNIIWAAGVKAPSILTTLNTPLDRQNRVIVKPDLSVPNHSEIFVIGDAAHSVGKDGKALPGVATVAIQQGQYVGNIILKQLNESQRAPFQYYDKGSMATIGKARAVALIGGRQFTGFIAWLIWSVVHITYLIGFPNRLIVFLEWVFWYITEKRGSRLIHEAIHPDESTELKENKK